MKRRYINIFGALALTMAIATQASAQDLPKSFNYQAMINADDGSPIANKEITVEISILQGNDCESGNCGILWQELHTPKTNDFGLFSVEIGDKNAINTMTGSLKRYSEIDWLNTTSGYYYMRVRVDFGEAQYLNGMTDLGTTKFSSVPYTLAALSAEKAKEATSLALNDNQKTALKVSQLDETNIVNPQKNQILVFDGNAWKNTDPAAAQGLTNIDITDVKEGQTLIYDATSGNWKNKSSQQILLNDIANVHTQTTNINDVLYYDGSAWTNGKIKLKDLMDVSASGANAPSNGQVLTYNNGSWAPSDAAGGGDKTTSIYELTKDVTIKKSDLKGGEVLTYNYDKNWWEAKANENIWQQDNTTKNYYTPKKVGIGTAIDGSKNGGDVLMIVATSSSSTAGTSLFSGKGITIGCSKDRVKGSGSIALGAGSVGDVQGAGCIVGNSASAEELAENSLVLGNKASTSAITSIVIGANSKANGNNKGVIGANLTAVNRDNSLTIGQFNVAGNSTANQLFAIGNGVKDAPSTCFYIKADGNGYISGNLDQASDARLKTNINTLENALDNVMKLRGVSFNWDKTKTPNASDGLQFGYIAQEVEKIFPNLVSENVNGYKSVNYTGMIPVLTEAIQDQQTEIEQLKKENEELKSTLEALLKRVEALENK